MKRHWKIVVLGMFLAAGLVASQAWADTVRLMTFTLDPQSSPALPIASCLDLSSAAGVQSTLGFNTPAPARLVIRYNAECAVGGPVTNYLNLDIIIDPAGAGAPFTAPPSNSDNAFCSGNGTASNNDGWVSAITQAFASVPAGAHTVRVCVNGVGAASTWRIDDTSLTIESTP